MMPPHKRVKIWLFLIILTWVVIIAVLSVTITPLSNFITRHNQQQPAASSTVTFPGGNLILTPHFPSNSTGDTTPSSATVTGITNVTPLNGSPHVLGNQIVDGSNHALLLRGGQVEGLFNVGTNQQTAQAFPTLVKVMHDRWNMNALRLPTCAWLWQQDQAGYMSRLQVAVQQANQAGLYVILDAYDAGGCNPTFAQDTYHLPRTNLDAYWTTTASVFRTNPMVIFDMYNEPAIGSTWRDKYTTAEWQLWLNGGTVNGQTYLGMQHLANTIRAAGAKQIIMVEGYAFGGTFYNIGQNLIADPLKNIVYEAHWYNLDTPQSQWDLDFGFMSATYPLFVGEWALLASDNHGVINCKDIPQSQADQTVTSFLNYMANHTISWTAYAFTVGRMLLDYTNYTPTTFQVPASTWCQESGQGGMGEDVKIYLTGSP